MRKTIKKKINFEFPTPTTSKKSNKNIDLTVRNSYNFLPTIYLPKRKNFYVNKIKETMWNNKCEAISEMNDQLYRTLKTSFDNFKNLK